MAADPTQEEASVLEDVYTNSPASYSSVNSLYKEAKRRDPNVTLKKVKQWLASKDTYTLHKPARRKFSRNRIRVSFIDEQWEVDLADLTSLHDQNDGYKWLLVCIDVLSKYAWVQPVKGKTGPQVATAIVQILDRAAPRKPLRIRSDKGGEFVNKQFKELLKDRYIDFITSQNEDTKCAIVERLNRTLKTRLWRYFTDKGTYKWIDVIQRLTDYYNNSRHRSIGCKPVEVTPENQLTIWRRLYPEQSGQEPMGNIRSKVLDGPAVGDHVRISKFKHVFEKGYLPNWTEEVFIVSKCLQRPRESYELKDLQNEPIIGTFYPEEIQKIDRVDDPNKVYKIERVIRKRKHNGQQEVLVKWFGYPDKFNSWVLQKDLVSV